MDTPDIYRMFLNDRSDPSDPDGAGEEGGETMYSFPRQSVTSPSDVNSPTNTKALFVVIHDLHTLS